MSTPFESFNSIEDWTPQEELELDEIDSSKFKNWFKKSGFRKGTRIPHNLLEGEETPLYERNKVSSVQEETPGTSSAAESSRPSSSRSSTRVNTGNNRDYSTFDIEDAAEGLVSTSDGLIGASGALGASSSIATVGGTIAGLGATAIGIGGLGYGIHKLTSGQTPGHEYLGPGTNLKKAGQPTDRDDEIAKTHDEAYSKAVDHNDIVKADNEAIHSFDQDWRDTGNWHSKVSGTLLGGKQAIENIVGPLYPQVCVH